jgi:hypothetical protein
VRRAKRGLGRLAGNAGLLGVTGLATFAASGAGAATAPQVFALTIRATTVADIDHTGAPTTASDGCTTASHAAGLLKVHFGTRRPVLVRFDGTQLQSVDVGPLDGTATLTGSNQVEETCAAGPPTVRTENCGKSTRTFRNAKTALRGTRPGTIAVGPVRVSLRAVDCPREPTELRQAILAPTPAPLRIALSSRSARVTLIASATRTRNYGSPEQGILQQRTTWRFTFVRHN